MMKLLIFGVILFLIFMMWSCLVVASDADDWMERNDNND